MFIESQLNNNNEYGSIEVICGSMFSGKTEELLRRLRRANFSKLKVEVYKPIIDTRYDNKDVVSHDKNTIDSIIVNNSKEILELTNSPDIVAIDEAQFFTDDLKKTCNTLASNGIRVIVAGLDMDFLGNPFGEIPNLLANYSFRITTNDEIINLGEKNNYKPLCRNCYDKKQINA